jgi:YHS domain-containing protein
MKTLFAALFAFSLALAAVAEEAQPLKPQTKCPIMGGAVNKNLYVDVQGQRIYVCCRGCLAPVKADPDKAFATLQKNGEYAESLQKTCPVMGGAIDKSLFVEYEGRRIYVCCNGCVETVRQNPAKYAKELVPKQEK